MSVQQIKGMDFIEDSSKANSMLAFLKLLRRSLENSPEYKLLYGKTQMFYNDNGRSRGEHSSNIGKTSANMAKKAYRKIHKDKINENQELYIINEKLIELYAEIMGLSHDLGHTPFGHDGEDILNNSFKELTRDDEELKSKIQQKREQDFNGIKIHISRKLADEKGFETTYPEYEEFQAKNREEIGFEHNEESAQKFSRIFDNLVEELRKNANTNQMAYQAFEGAMQANKNMLIEGILAHSRSRFPGVPEYFISQIVRQADKIEYMNYDFEEFDMMGCFPLEEGTVEYEKFMERLKQRCKSKKEGIEDLDPEEVLEYLKLSGDERRNLIEDQIIEEALGEKGKIDDNMKAMRMAKICANFKDDILFYIDENGKQGLISGNNVERQQLVIEKVVDYYITHPEKVPTEKLITPISPLNLDEIPDESVVAFAPDNLDLSNTYEKVKEYISSLTNEQLEEQYKNLVKERINNGKGHGIEPITQEKVETKLEKNSAKIKKSEKVEEYLPKKIKDIIDENRQKHKKQVENDELLYQEMLDKDNERQTKQIQEMHDQKSDQFFEDIETGKYNVPEQYMLKDYEEFLNDRTKGNVAKATNETIVEVRREEQTKEEVTIGEGR